MTLHRPHNTPNPPLLVDTQEAARMLAVSERTLWKLKAEGVIPHIRIGSLVRYRIEDLRAWIASRQTSTPCHGDQP